MAADGPRGGTWYRVPLRPWRCHCLLDAAGDGAIWVPGLRRPAVTMVIVTAAHRSLGHPVAGDRRCRPPQPAHPAVCKRVPGTAARYQVPRFTRYSNLASTCLTMV